MTQRWGPNFITGANLTALGSTGCFCKTEQMGRARSRYGGRVTEFRARLTSYMAQAKERELCTQSSMAEQEGQGCRALTHGKHRLLTLFS